MRHAACARRTFADSVDDVRTATNNAAGSLIHNNTGEAIDAFEVFWGRYASGKDGGWLSDIAKAARKMADALDKFADKIDDAIKKLWTQISIDAVAIAGGILLTPLTGGASDEVAAEIVSMSAGLGIAVSEAVAGIAAEMLVGAAFTGVYSVAVDVAVAQPVKIALHEQHGFSLDEVNAVAKDGMVSGGLFGAGIGVLKPGVARSLFPQFDGVPPLLRPPSIRPDLIEEGPSARPADECPCTGEPIDVATGAMLLTHTDLSLPGALPLVFSRTHLSSFRGGVCFGPTWASILDERVQLDRDGVVFAADDGMRLVYPVPRPGVPTLPVKGPRWPLEWDGKPDGVMTVTDPATGVVRTFAHPGPSAVAGAVHLPLESRQDRNGARIDIDRAMNGAPVAIRHSGGYYLAVDTEGPRVTALRLLDRAPSLYELVQDNAPGTVVVRYGYDDAGNLTEVVNSSGRPLRFTYDDEGRITSWTDRNDTTFRYVYDAAGRVVRTEGTDGIFNGRLEYDDHARVTVYTDSLGHRRRYMHNADGQVVEETDPLGRTTRTVWNDRGDLRTSVTDKLGRTTGYAYDDSGRLTELRLPDGATARASYNELCLPVEVVEPGGAVWRHAYDGCGNLLATIDPADSETRYGYDEVGHLASVTDPLGRTRRVTCNAAGLPTAVTDALGNATTVQRDAFGRVTAVTDPLGHTTRTHWTVEGKPTRREYPDGTAETWTWDGEGSLLAHTDAAGNTTRHTPGPFDVPVGRTDPDGTTYRFAYDTELRLIEVVNPVGLTWTYTYDPAGRLISETDFNGRTLAYTYNAADELETRSNGAGETLRYTRDALGRTAELRDDAGTITTYAYNTRGQLTGATNPDSEIVLERDALGRVLSETVNGRTTRFAYDPTGRTTSRITPSGLRSEWTYDAAGHPVGLRNQAGHLTFAYDAAGRETELHLANGVTLTQTWDAVDRLTTQTVTHAGRHPADRLVQHRTYAYREDGHLTEIRDLTAGSRRFDLDQLGRVTAVHAHGWTETYAYDPQGNLTHATAPAHPSPGDREFTGTLVRRAGRTRYQHDAQGRLVRRTRKLLNGQSRVWTYTWNAEDRLTDVVTPDGDHWHYTYDPLGRRVSKQRLTHDGEVAKFIEFAWDGTRLAEQSHEGLDTTWDYAPDTHRPLTQTTRRTTGSRITQLTGAPEFHAIVTDPVGAPAELISSTGDLAWQHRTTLWGVPLPAPSGTTACPLRHPGQYADLEIGLHYNHHRYYDPETASYLSPDPLGLQPADNHHAYVPNPLGWSDPLGLQRCTQDVLDKSYELDNTPRKLEHVIDPPKHGFDQLVEESGGREQAFRRIVNSLGEKDDLPESGGFVVNRTIDGEVVTIRGAMVQGVPRVGTAFIAERFPGK
jgi:RHS repeat-associated protein